ncbi:MAG: hypothetical protein ACJA0Q_002234, partial [Saprospiraceae bacterium]
TQKSENKKVDKNQRIKCVCGPKVPTEERDHELQ